VTQPSNQVAAAPSSTDTAGESLTPQERLWAGDFGKDYTARNADPILVASSVRRWARMLSAVPGQLSSAVELGANLGVNLRALRALCPTAELTGVEINPVAAQQLREWAELDGNCDVNEGSLLGFRPEQPAELSFTSVVLIHVNPDRLPEAYDALYASSNRWILVSEYHNPTPVEIKYRGETGALFKRDFGGELLERFPDLRLVDYGFFSRHDAAIPLADDYTWFLMEKRES
jgi:pseudaminic acid biosynthesis-associated methylase